MVGGFEFTLGVSIRSSRPSLSVNLTRPSGARLQQWVMFSGAPFATRHYMRVARHWPSAYIRILRMCTLCTLCNIFLWHWYKTKSILYTQLATYIYTHTYTHQYGTMYRSASNIIFSSFSHICMTDSNRRATQNCCWGCWGCCCTRLMFAAQCTSKLLW